MSDHCEICLLRNGDHLEWCWDVRRTRKHAFLEAAEIVENTSFKNLNIREEVVSLLREKAEETKN